MNDYVWMDPKPCYQKYLKLNLAHNAVLVYRSSNNMNAFIYECFLLYLF